MRIITVLTLLVLLVGCGFYQQYKDRDALDNRIKYGDIWQGHNIELERYSITLPFFGKNPKWRHFGDKRKPNEFGLSAGLTSDVHASRMYAQYGVSAKALEVDCEISDLATAKKCIESMSFDYDWNLNLVKIPNENGERCFANNDNETPMKDNNLLMYQASCLHNSNQFLVVFNVSELSFLENTTPDPDLAKFANNLFASFKSK